MSFSVSVCIPTMRRFSFLKDSIPKYLANPQVTELIVTDETGEDYDAITHAFSHPKLRVYKNEHRLGAIANKQRAASYATGDYTCIVDSDNYAPPEYFQAFRSYLSSHPTTESTVFLPCFARPSFNYTRFIGTPITKFNVHMMYPDINACLNTMNLIVKTSFLRTYNLMNHTPWCVDADGAHDALYFSLYSLFEMNASLVVVPGMEYDHVVHKGSWYMETVDRSRYVYQRLMSKYFPTPVSEPISQMTLSEWQTTYKNPNTLIVQASSMNVDDAWMPFPIGMQYGYHLVKDFGSRLQIGPHDRLVFCGITPSTDSTRRPNGKNRASILATLAKNGIANSKTDTFYQDLPSYKFVISPEGNGIDCHRHYEALLAGCIPIVERNPLTEAKYAGCPVLFTDDYSEITPDYLEGVYPSMRDAVYNFSCLNLTAYSPEVQSTIKQCGNFWMKRITGREWY